MRTVLRRDARTHIAEMLNELQWMSTSQRIHYNALKFIHKITTGNAPKYLQIKLNKVNQVHNRNTRQNNNYYIPLCTKENTRNLLLVRGLKIYNEAINRYESQNCNNSFLNFLRNYAKEFF